MNKKYIMSENCKAKIRIGFFIPMMFIVVLSIGNHLFTIFGLIVPISVLLAFINAFVCINNDKEGMK